VYDEDLTNLDEWIRRLKVDYDIFLNGHRKKPPDDLRMRVERLVKRLAEATDMSFSQRFRYNTLIARFYVYRDMWRRSQQDMESAAGPSRKPMPPGRDLPPDAQRNANPREVQVSISNPESEGDKVRHLYQELQRARAAVSPGAPAIPYEQVFGLYRQPGTGHKAETAVHRRSLPYRSGGKNDQVHGKSG
jgi:hypothetical protein